MYKIWRNSKIILLLKKMITFRNLVPTELSDKVLFLAFLSTFMAKSTLFHQRTVWQTFWCLIFVTHFRFLWHHFGFNCHFRLRIVRSNWKFRARWVLWITWNIGLEVELRKFLMMLITLSKLVNLLVPN